MRRSRGSDSRSCCGPIRRSAQAQTNLRKVLHNLRRALPDVEQWIDIGPRTLRWREDAPVWLDVEQFEQALAAGRFADAIDVYAGALLEGRYDEWLLEERERLAHLHLDALEHLVRSHREERRWPEAIRCAERLVAGDPLREESHRLSMDVFEAAGDRARAAARLPRLRRDAGAGPRDRAIGRDPCGVRIAHRRARARSCHGAARDCGAQAGTRHATVRRACGRARAPGGGLGRGGGGAAASSSSSAARPASARRASSRHCARRPRP